MLKPFGDSVWRLLVYFCYRRNVVPCIFSILPMIENFSVKIVSFCVEMLFYKAKYVVIHWSDYVSIFI